MERKPLNIAMLGSKGLPAEFGGIERHVEQIGKRLVQKGHRVTVYGRYSFSKKGRYMGMENVLKPSIPTKNLETATNSLISTLDALLKPYDIIHYHGIGPSIFSIIPVIFGRVTVSTIHAQDYRQSKWGRVAKAFLRLGERNAVKYCTATISVSKHMAEILGGKFNSELFYIPNGATIQDIPPFERAKKFGLESKGYILTVGRFIVERGFHTLLEAFNQVDTNKRLVIIGSGRFESEYASRLKGLADPRVCFPGYISGPILDELYAHSFFYVLPSLVEGLPISLIEAMSFKRPILISDIPENLEVAKDIGVTFKRGDIKSLREGLECMLTMDDEERNRRGEMARRRIEKEYNWDKIVDSLESLYYNLVEE